MPSCMVSSQPRDRTQVCDVYLLCGRILYHLSHQGSPRILEWVAKLYLGILYHPRLVFLGFPGDSDGKESACNAEDLSLIPGSGRSPGEGNGYPVQCSFLENSMDRGAWWDTIHKVAKSQTRLKVFHFHCAPWVSLVAQ